MDGAALSCGLPLTPTTLERPYLNPDWVEWLMGFPRKWTDIPFGPKNLPTSRA